MDFVLFGAGQIGERAYQRLGHAVIAVIDNNPPKVGQQFHGVPIISLEDYKKDYSGAQIIISANAPEIVEQLKAENIENTESVFAVELFDTADVYTDPDIMHERWPLYLKQLCDKEGFEVLEIGSRMVTGDYFRGYFELANYTGFDYYPGDNVDVVGDAHKLSTYFDKKFDLIFSSAVFEHLAMPWMVSLEVIKLLKPGGYVFVETHYAQGSHERPWDFFRFSENGLDVLFSEKFGMKCVKKGCCNLLESRFSQIASSYLAGRFVPGLYCHSEYLGQKVRELPENMLSWDGIALEDVSGGTEYPHRKHQD